MSNRSMPYEFCPSFIRCSVNACPLDPDHRQHPNLPADPDRCPAEQPTRLRIIAEQRAADSPHVAKLPFGGLTEKEDRRRRRQEAFAALPEEERRKRLARLRPFSKREAEGEENNAV